jgi:hypothetical protein
MAEIFQFDEDGDTRRQSSHRKSNNASTTSLTTDNSTNNNSNEETKDDENQEEVGQDVGQTDETTPTMLDEKLALCDFDLLCKLGQGLPLLLLQSDLICFLFCVQVRMEKCTKCERIPTRKCML